ncbi:MAG: DeoR/GlpR family DNA-binding transcription regulator [Clostridiales bacterium]|nr:DeoR/GlpR family DNA-binding transcription regulator [Clostridiales bacterium]
MIKNERLDEIMDILSEKKYCTVNELASAMYVTPITIRRDLKLLEQQGVVNKCYGGVSVITHSNRDVPLIVREASNHKSKDLIAKEAIKMIAEGSTVFLDASSTAAHIAEHLTPEQHVTVITNGIKALTILAERQITAYGTGGKLLGNSLAFAGANAEAMVSGMNVDTMFFSSQGITLDGNISDYSEHETKLRQIMLKRAKRKYFLFDSSKVSKTYLFHVCNIADVDGYFCDKTIQFNL